MIILIMQYYLCGMSLYEETTTCWILIVIVFIIIVQYTDAYQFEELKTNNTVTIVNTVTPWTLYLYCIEMQLWTRTVNFKVKVTHSMYILI